MKNSLGRDASSESNSAIGSFAPFGHNQHDNQFLTLKQAARLVGKTTSNISYLVQYNRIGKYDSRGGLLSQRAPNGGLRISKRELLAYTAQRKRDIQSRMRELNIQDTRLAFHDVSERERTKHVHRLHPYLGKFIPQLVDYFLSRHFKRDRNDVVIDPFSGSATTLVQAAERGLHSVGVEISEFNIMISRVKLADYNLTSMEGEVLDIVEKTKEFSTRRFQKANAAGLVTDFSTESEYLKTWFAPQSLQELLYFNSLIPNYEYQELLRVLLSRTTRSCRLVHHYDIATPKEPVSESYHCYKHKGKLCRPVTTIIPRLSFYSRDTIQRIKEFALVRKPCQSRVVEGDSRLVRLKESIPENNSSASRRIGVFTSPPYVGQIDYHEQHRYAYELFGMKRRDDLEIGPKAAGKSERALADYTTSVTEVFMNIREYLTESAAIVVVANDRFGLYPGIFEEAGMRIERSFERPVEDRTERDKRPYSETVFLARLER